MIIERTQEGKAIAKKNDFKEGRPKKYTPKQLCHAIDMLKDNSYNEGAQITGISKSKGMPTRSSKFCCFRLKPFYGKIRYGVK